MLRKEGYNIETIMEYNKDKSKRYARYYLREVEKVWNFTTQFPKSKNQ